MAGQNDQGRLRGGTQGGEAARLIDPDNGAEGTPGNAPSGGARPEAPSRYASRTGLEGRAPGTDEMLSGGKTVAQISGYLQGVSYPANKEDVIRAARRGGAPDDVLADLSVMTRPHYSSFDEVAADYPRLPDRDAVETTKGGSSSK